MGSLGEAFPKEQARVREVLGIYKEMPLGAGSIGASMIEITLREADKAVIEGDLVKMIRVYKEMQAIE